MSTARATFAALVLDAEGCVAIDLLCPGCAYNLRTRPASAVCPECAHPVEAALQLHFRQLRFSSPKWLAGLRTGLALLLAAIGAGIFGVLVLWVVWLASFAAWNPAAGPAQLPWEPMRIVVIAQFVVALVVNGFILAGVLLFTRREPVADTEPEGVSARRVGRVLVWCMTVVTVLVFGGYIVALYSPAMLEVLGANLQTRIPSTSQLVLFGVVGVIMGLIPPSLALALLRHLAKLLRRIPRVGLARFARIEFWVLLVGPALVIGGYAAALLATLPMIRAARSVASGAIVTTMPTTSPVVVGYGGVPIGTATTTSAPATAPLVSLGYVSATSAPASAPTTMFVPPVPTRPAMAMMMGGALTAVFGYCGTLVGLIAGVVLLIMSCIALNQAALDAEHMVARVALMAAAPHDDAGKP